MYPVISILRRASLRVLFVDRSIVDVKDGLHVLNLDGRVRYIDFSKEEWTDGLVVPVFSLSTKAPSKVGAALELLRHENRIAKKLKLVDLVYTLFVSDEKEEFVDETFVRTFIVGAVMGNYVWRGRSIARAEGAREERTPIRAPSRGAAREER